MMSQWHLGHHHSSSLTVTLMTKQEPMVIYNYSHRINLTCHLNGVVPKVRFVVRLGLGKLQILYIHWNISKLQYHMLPYYKNHALSSIYNRINAFYYLIGQKRPPNNFKPVSAIVSLPVIVKGLWTMKNTVLS